MDHCTWRFNRRMAIEAHKFGFAVFEREEVERRLLFKSDAHFPGHFPKYVYIYRYRYRCRYGHICIYMSVCVCVSLLLSYTH